MPSWTIDVDDTNGVSRVQVAAIRISRLGTLESLYFLLHLFRTFFIEALFVGREFIE